MSTLLFPLSWPLPSSQRPHGFMGKRSPAPHGVCARSLPLSTSPSDQSGSHRPAIGVSQARLPGVSRARLPGVSRARLPDSQACLNVPDHGVDNSLFSQPLDGNSLIISDTNHCASRLDRRPDNRRSSDRLRPDSHSTRPPFRSCDTPL